MALKNRDYDKLWTQVLRSFTKVIKSFVLCWVSYDEAPPPFDILLLCLGPIRKSVNVTKRTSGPFLNLEESTQSRANRQIMHCTPPNLSNLSQPFRDHSRKKNKKTYGLN